MTSSKDLTLKRVIALHKLFKEGMIPTLSQHEVNPGHEKGSRENYLYFTLASCINFQRNSPAMWASALKTYNDPETRYLFLPEEVVKKDREQIQRDLLKHKLGLQKNKHTDIWIIISRALHELFNDDPRELLKKGDWDVIKIQELLQKTHRKELPYISGPKLSNYWLYILTHYTDAKFTNMEAISIIPDTHVLQGTLKLGLSTDAVSPLIAAELWRELLEGSGVSPVEMHPVLWNWSRNNFQPEV